MHNNTPTWMFSLSLFFSPLNSHLPSFSVFLFLPLSLMTLSLTLALSLSLPLRLSSHTVYPSRQHQTRIKHGLKQETTLRGRDWTLGDIRCSSVVWCHILPTLNFRQTKSGWNGWIWLWLYGLVLTDNGRASFFFLPWGTKVVLLWPFGVQYVCIPSHFIFPSLRLRGLREY